MSNGQPAVRYSWTDSYAHIRNPYLVVLVRVVVAIFIALWIVTTVVHLPSNFQLRRSSILALAATSNDLSGLGISIEAVALYNLVVVEAVFSLKPRERDILLRRIVYRDSVNQLAAEYNLKPETISVILIRAKHAVAAIAASLNH